MSLKCPMTLSGPDEGRPCLEADCAWWHKYTKSCAVAVLGNTFTLFQKYGYGSKPRDGGKKEEFS